MSWNYRVTEKNGLYSIREVYYTKKKKKVKLWSTTPQSPPTESVDELREMLTLMLMATYNDVIEVAALADTTLPIPTNNAVEKNDEQ